MYAKWIFFLFALLALGALGSESGTQEARPLKPGWPVESELASGERHTYEIPLAAHQYIEIRIEAPGQPLLATLSGRGGRPLVEADSLKYPDEIEAIGLIAETAGSYRLQVRSAQKEAPVRRYRIRIEVLRAATEQDQMYVTAQRGLAEGRRWAGVGSTTERKRQCIGKLESLLPLWRAVADRRGEATTLNIIGVVYNSLGEKQKALDYYGQALPLRRAVEDRQGEASTLNNIGVVYDSLGEKQKALDCYGQALPLQRAVGDRRGEAYTLSNIGVVYNSLGEKQKALDCYGQALPLRRAVGDRQGEASTLNNIGVVYESLGEKQKVLDYYGRALSLMRAVGDRQGEASTLGNIGAAYTFLGQKQKALDYFDQALPLRRAAGDRRGEAHILSSIGTVYESLGEKQKALDYYGQALPLQRAVGDRPGEVKTLYGIARTERGRGHWTEALYQMDAALKIIESLRTEIASPDLRASYFATVQNSYAFAIDLLMQVQAEHPDDGRYRQQAFAYAERAKARSFLERLIESQIDPDKGLDPEWRERKRKLQAELTRLQQNWPREYEKRRHDKAQLAALEKERNRLDDEYSELIVDLRQRHPQYAQLRYPQPQDLSQTQALLDKPTVLLAYSLSPEACYLFALTRHDYQVYRLSGEKTLAESVAALRRVLAKPDPVWEATERAHSQYGQLARKLYRDLVAPAAALLKGRRRLVIVPDGILHYLPFELLLTGSPSKSGVDFAKLPYLVRDYEIHYVPSATAWATLKSRRPEGTSGEQKELLAVADPLYKAAGVAGRRSDELDWYAVRDLWDERAGALRPLPYSRQEVEAIARLFPKEQVRLCLGPDASERQLKALDLTEYKRLHFATHGVLNEARPQYSALVLSFAETGGEDGYLTMREVFELKLRAELVVLSACQTGLGQQVRGEGVQGLARAFLYAGTPRVLVSLWKVSDRSTAELMRRFYRHLKASGVNKATALRQAQWEMIRTGRYSHPYYWAPFILIGDK